MTQIQWGARGERFFQTGIDRGVIYPRVGPAVPWNGLVSVSESRSIGRPKAFYQDGVKHLNAPPPRDFGAKIKSITRPPVLERLAGMQTNGKGLYYDNQPPEAFDLTYRTLIGNDVAGSGLAYKIHLLFNVLTTPVETTHSTYNDEVEPMEFTYELGTTKGLYPAAHVAFDSRHISEHWLNNLQWFLYGKPMNSQAPRMLTPAEVRAFLGVVTSG